MFERLKKIGIFNGNGFSKDDSILSCDDFKKLIAKERIRADRGDHRYSLLVLTLNFDQQKNADRLSRAIQEIRQRIRALDEIGWHDKNQLGIILPYTSREGAAQLAHQICETINAFSNASNGVACEVFCYDPGAGDFNCSP